MNLNSAAVSLSILLSLSSCSVQNRDNSVIWTGDIAGVAVSGDILMRRCDGVVSGISANTSRRDKRYSHAGIVVFRGDSVMVVHSDFDAAAVVCQPVGQYLKEASRWGLYRLDADVEVRGRVASVAEEFAQAAIPFDFGFDNADSTKLYCTQMVAMAVNAAMDSVVVRPETVINGKYFFANDDVFINNCIFLVAESDSLTNLNSF